VNVSAQDKDRIYQEYLKAFKKGVYNYIKEDPDPTTGQTIPRKYFSGGVVGRIAPVIEFHDLAMITSKDMAALSKSLVKIDGDMAMLNQSPESPENQMENSRNERVKELIDIYQKISPFVLNIRDSTNGKGIPGKIKTIFEHAFIILLTGLQGYIFNYENASQESKKMYLARIRACLDRLKGLLDGMGFNSDDRTEQQIRISELKLKAEKIVEKYQLIRGSDKFQSMGKEWQGSVVNVEFFSKCA
jgi:hypothetical protein